MDADAYCREIEAHLCRRNAGHLVRVAGPAFEMVAGWAAKGIPLKVALSGIDRAVDRRDAKGPSRRPLRVEFCEADVLDAFDAWRRAVGVGTAGGGAAERPGAGDSAAEDTRRKHGAVASRPSRPRRDQAHRLRRGRLRSPATSNARSNGRSGNSATRGRQSRSLRGEARAAFIARLQAVDAELLAAARAATPPDVLDALTLRSRARNWPRFATAWPPDDYSRAVEAATMKLLRERLKLPDIAY